MARYENFRQVDIDDLNAEAKRADAKHGSQLDVPFGTGEMAAPLADISQALFVIGLSGEGATPRGEHVRSIDVANAAREACQKAFREGRGTWAGILLEEVFEALAEPGGVPADEKLEMELLQVAATALRMREIARHHRIIAELEQRQRETIEKYGVFPNCHHKNYGTREKPASVMYDCIDCREYYCDDCNYDRHVCGGCGEPYRHGEEPHPGVSCVDEEPTDAES